MACSNDMLGYENDRFEIVISDRFQCPICLLVLRDPVMCKNEHHYCSSCIKRHLEESESCPTCRIYLSVETLQPAPKIVTNFLSELKIRCDFNSRGCPEMVQVGELKRHVESCGFSPVQCSNDGCNVVVNARDKLHHETEVCGFRRCHDCERLEKRVEDIKNRMMVRQDQMKIEMESIIKKKIKDDMREMKEEMEVLMKRELVGLTDEIVDEITKELKEEVKNEIRNEMKVDMESEIEVKVEKMKEEMKDEMKLLKEEMKDEMKLLKDGMTNEMKLFKDEMTNEMKLLKEKVEDEMKEMKVGMQNELKEIVTKAVQDAVTGIKGIDFGPKNQQSSQATCPTPDGRENIFLVGGQHRGGRVMNKCTECFDWEDKTWTRLSRAEFNGRSYLCSFWYQDQMMVAGGSGSGGNKETMKCLNVTNPSAQWKDFSAKLPVKCSAHKVVCHKDSLFLSGGFAQTGRSDAVYEIQLVRPYSSKILKRLPQPRSNHGMEMVQQKLFIFGGHDGEKITASVIQYDLNKRGSKEMPPLPYRVQDMATVLWGDHVLVIGGFDARGQCLSKVLMYDVITGRSEMLPNMKQKRCGCTAVLTGNVVVVMGGRNAESEDMKSVECFDLERRVWEDLPDMIEPRTHATAVVKPNH